MNKTEIFPFNQADKIQSSERQIFKKAYKNTFLEKPPQRGRPHKVAAEKYIDIHIKLNPRILAWTHLQAKKQGIGYQTLINEILLKHAT